jgi:tight adherence protein B
MPRSSRMTGPQVRSRPPACRRWPRGRPLRRNEPDAALPELLELTARSLRAGESLSSAVQTAAREVGAAFTPSLSSALGRVDRGPTHSRVCREWAEQVPSVGRQMFAAIVGLSSELGGGAAHTFDTLALTLRARSAARSEARVLATQARASAMIIGVLPIVMSAVVVVAAPGTAVNIVRYPVCRLSFAGGCLAESVAFLWIRRLTRWTR